MKIFKTQLRETESIFIMPCHLILFSNKLFQPATQTQGPVLMYYTEKILVFQLSAYFFTLRKLIFSLGHAYFSVLLLFIHAILQIGHPVFTETKSLLTVPKGLE